MAADQGSSAAVTAHSDPRPRGVLLINLGSPEATTPRAVKRYLRQFLSDPKVLDFPAPLRRALLEAVVLPVRSRRSARMYQSIWTTQGSPLLVHTKALAEALHRDLTAGEAAQKAGSSPWVIEWAMRYGQPSIEQAWHRLRSAQVRDVIVVPLYPQETSSTIGSAMDELRRVMARDWVPTPLRVVPPFHADPGFLNAVSEVAAESLAQHEVDHVLFSFHSIPERHISKADASGSHCLAAQYACCSDTASPVAAGCYRAQCARTAAGLAQRLSLAPSSWSIAFQSRLGRIPWAQPYTDLELDRLAAAGIKKIAVVCAAFTADNLETLEEIGIRGRRRWLAAGGEHLVLVPGLNARASWVRALSALVRA